MFYYLGRKKRIAHLYPKPKFDTIVEPFAGSAAYSLHGDHWKKQVILNDLSDNVHLVWNYLLQANSSDIDKLPKLSPGDKLSDIKALSEAERWLIAFHINPGANQRSNVVTKFSRWGAGQCYISKNLFKIKHWKIYNQDYLQLADIEATWFVDPPYQKSGKFYMTNTVNFDQLKLWCLSRRGQTIVCEQEGANWLPFRSLVTIDICGKSKSKEVIYCN